MSTGAAAPKEPTVLNEEDDVFRWRAEQFRQLGFNEVEAHDLAASPADLGQARYLLGSGCPQPWRSRSCRSGQPKTQAVGVERRDQPTEA